MELRCGGPLFRSGGKGNGMRKIVILLCMIVFFASGYYVLHYIHANMSAQNNFREVTQLKVRGLDAVYEENSDVVGWVEIVGTKIDYPVMQTTEASGKNDPEYYLHRDFDKEQSDSGTPFLDVASSIAGATRLLDSESGEVYLADASTWNWLVYGHHMKYGTMFHDLLKYEEEAFWKAHKTFRFDRINIGADGTISEIDEEYEVIAAGYSQIYPEGTDAFKYYEYAGYYDEDTFDEYIAGVKAESCYDTGLTAAYGDQLVTLSTCAYQVEDGRFYVVGKRK